MARIYISSTYSDLKDYRAAVATALQRLDHQVVAMEHYVAADDRPLDKCLADVARCNLYVGIFAFKYGFVPTKGNPEGRSITELEYLEAGRQGKSRLIFLVADDAPWKRSLMDEVTGENEAGARIRALRKELGGEHTLSSFETVDQLDSLATAAVATWDREQAKAPPPPAAIVVPARPTGPAGPPVVPDVYRQWLLKQCASIELLGLKLKHGQFVRLDNVYVPLTTIPGGRAAMSDKERTSLADAIRPERDRATLLLHRLGESSLYVSGDPGSGKSTFCRWVSWLACEGDVPPPDVETAEELQEHFPDSLRGRLPVFIPLHDFCAALPDAPTTTSLSRLELEGVIGGWIDRTSPGRLTGEAVVAHLRAGSALLLLDGVDEVPPGQRDLLLASLSQAVPEWTRANRVLVTSRPYGLSDADVRQLGLPAAPIQALAPQMQDLLVRRWFRILADNAAAGDASAADMLQQVRSQAWLAPLLANPLLLTAACIVFNDGKRLPQDKHELYDRLVDVVLSNRM